MAIVGFWDCLRSKPCVVTLLTVVFLEFICLALVLGISFQNSASLETNFAPIPTTPQPTPAAIAGSLGEENCSMKTVKSENYTYTYAGKHV